MGYSLNVWISTSTPAVGEASTASLWYRQRQPKAERKPEVRPRLSHWLEENKIIVWDLKSSAICEQPRVEIILGKQKWSMFLHEQIHEQINCETIQKKKIMYICNRLTLVSRCVNVGGQ